MASFCESLLTLLMLGTDSLIAGLAIGPVFGLWRQRAVFAFLFGFCDGAAAVLGAAMRHRVPEASSALLYLVAVALIVQGVRRSPAWLYALPVLFSVDNFAAATAASEAPALALGSAAMAGVGLALGGMGRSVAIRLARSPA